MGNINNEDEEKYCLTPWGCLYYVLTNYGIETDHITGTIGEHLVEDFMAAMAKQGYVVKGGGEDDDN